MKRDGAAWLVEFTTWEAYSEAVQRMEKAFPGKMQLTGYSDQQKHQLVLNTNEELVYLQMIESDLKK